MAVKLAAVLLGLPYGVAVDSGLSGLCPLLRWCQFLLEAAKIIVGDFSNLLATLFLEDTFLALLEFTLKVLVVCAAGLGAVSVTLIEELV